MIVSDRQRLTLMNALIAIAVCTLFANLAAELSVVNEPVAWLTAYLPYVLFSSYWIDRLGHWVTHGERWNFELWLLPFLIPLLAVLCSGLVFGIGLWINRYFIETGLFEREPTAVNLVESLVGGVFAGLVFYCITIAMSAPLLFLLLWRHARRVRGRDQRNMAQLETRKIRPG